MKSVFKYILIATIFSITVFALLEGLNILEGKALAYSTSCPPGMTDQQCLDYLQQQASQLNKEKQALSGKLSTEQYNQLSLLEKINYLNSQVTLTQKQIDELEIKIETKNVEIRLLGKDIAEKQEHVNTLDQEITKLNTSIKKRISISYKYSLLTPIEILFENQNFDSLLRRFKYLAESRRKDKELLEEMSTKQKDSNEEKKVLEDKKLSVEKLRAEIEDQKTDLYTQKQALSKQKSERSSLYAISKQKESEYQASLKALKKQSDIITSQITQLIFNMFQSGSLPANTPVKKGDIIGFQGHSGLAYGSHLHFELRKNGAVINPYSAGYFVWSNGSGSARFPEDGAMITQFPHYNNSAIDMVSGSYGNQNGDKYWTSGVKCVYGSVPSGYYNMKGEGAPLRAIKDGKVTAVHTDACGGKYVLVDYGGGLTSLYLHLR